MKIKQPKTIHMYRFSKHTNLTQHTYRLHVASTEVSTLFNENQQPKTIHMYRYAALYFSKYTNLTDIHVPCMVSRRQGILLLQCVGTHKKIWNKLD